jgi:16S rRNA (guanine527-N7)-methyltransferase
MLDAARIADLLHPFLGDSSASPELTCHLQTYLELLLRWNARINLTAVRDPEQIVTRHFGESLFAARVLRDVGAFTGDQGRQTTVADIGAGAGFPGIPIKLLVPEVGLTLIESQNKKATFLRELIRTLSLSDTQVFCGRAEAWPHTADVVTLRAVEKFETVLPTAATLVSLHGRLCLLSTNGQVESLRRALGALWRIDEPVPIPLSSGRVILMARPRLPKF